MNEHFWRFRLVQIALITAGLAIIFQIIFAESRPEAQIFIKQGAGFEGEESLVYPARGEIFDRNGHLLAGNDPVYEVGVERLHIRNRKAAEEIAVTLQVQLGLDYTTVLDLLTDESQNYVMVGKFVPYEKVQAFYKFRDALTGSTYEEMNLVYFVPDLIRTYPEKDLASNVLGLINWDGTQRSFGVEEKYDSLLSGTGIRMWIPYNPNEARKLTSVPPASDIILTIDREIQSSAEVIIDDAVKTYDAKSGVIIVADPKTGEILAMASSPRIDPNQYWEPQFVDLVIGKTPFNPAVSETYEPGSVFKILTMAAALDKGVVRPETIYNDTNGVFMIGGFGVHNWNNAAWGPQDMTGCLQHSLNVCLAWVATELGKDDFYSYLNRFGIGHQTGIDLAGEETGLVKTFEGPEWQDSFWDEAELGINAYGQGVSVTPIQMVMAVSAVANDGNMPRPHVLRAAVQDGRQYDMPIEIVGSPISAETAHTLSEMLANSLENETTQALVPGYRLAGKTGTATIQTKPNSNATNTSFVGWGPIDDPKFLIYVWLKEPTASIWGSETAAPVFKQMAQKVIVLMGIPPDQVRMSLTGQ